MLTLEDARRFSLSKFIRKSMLQRPNTSSLLAMAGLLLGLWIAPAKAQSNDELTPLP